MKKDAIEVSIEEETEKVTESIIDEIVEGMSIAIVSELVIGGGKLLEALRGYSGEIPGELRVLCENHSTARNKAVDQGLLPHGRR